MVKGKNNKLFYILVVLFIAVVLTWLAITRSNNTRYPIGGANYSQTERYTSKFLNIEFIIPSEFSVEDKQVDILLKKNDSTIDIGRTGTNFESPEEYLVDLSAKNKFQITEEKKLSIDEYPALKVIIKHPFSGDPDTYAYFVYKDYAVYRISTNNKNLLGDLDEIAKSFRYTP